MITISPSSTWLRDIMVVSDGEMVEDGQQNLTAQLLQALRLLVGRHPLCHLTTGVKYWAGDWAEKRPLWAENSWKMRPIWWIDMYLQLKNRFYIEDLVSFERNRNRNFFNLLINFLLKTPWSRSIIIACNWLLPSPDYHPPPTPHSHSHCVQMLLLSLILKSK